MSKTGSESINTIIVDGNSCTEKTQYYDSFVTTCIKELRTYHTCICFNKEHLKGIIAYFGEENIKYVRRDEFYYEVTYAKPKNKN